MGTQLLKKEEIRLSKKKQLQVLKREQVHLSQKEHVEVSKREQSKIVSILVTNLLYYMC